MVWASIGAARSLATSTADRLLASALLAWGNIVVTGLLLATWHHLGEARWFFSTSLILAGLTCLRAGRALPSPASVATAGAGLGSGPNPWLVGAFCLSIAPLVLAVLAIAYTYQPNNPDALTWELPRAMYYLGQNTLAQFTTADLRQVELPFNSNLLQVFGLVYGAPLQCLNLFNIAAWAISGIAVYRICRLGALEANASLIACWFSLTSMPVVAGATSTTSMYLAGAALLCGLVFLLQWNQTRNKRDALLAGLAAGLAIGTSVSLLLVLAIAAPLCLAIGWQRERRAGRQTRAHQIRPWILPSLVALAVGAPFALVNLRESGSWLSLGFFQAHQAQWINPITNGWDWIIPLLQTPPPLLPLNEDSAGFGLTGPLVLLGGFLCLGRLLPSARPIIWIMGLAIGEFLIRVLLHWWWPASPRDFVPALWLLAPGLAAAWGACWISRPVFRLAGCVIVLGIAATAEWSAMTYLLRNTMRPLLPLLNSAFVPPALPTMPMLLDYRLGGQSRINVETDGINERIFPLMTLGQSQKFTSHGQIDPAAYNLLSRAGASRNAPYLNPSQSPSYVMVPIPSKHTAGVEFLASLGTGAEARDYFGIEPQAGETAPIDSNRSLLVTLYHNQQNAKNEPGTRLRVAGLNPKDHARLDVNLEYEDGSIAPLASFSANGETTVMIAKPFRHLAFRVREAITGAEIGAAVLPYRAAIAENTKAIDPSRPTSDSSLFVTDLVLSRNSTVSASEGLLATEGPFPQWDLPFIRWARQSVITIRIPPTDKLARLQLSFSARLHVRKKGALEVWFNGQLMQHHRIEGQSTWLDRIVDLTPKAGENILEFRDAPLLNEPDWMDYLERYPDVKKYLIAHKIPLEQGAREHYETNGRAEGRPYDCG